MTPTLEQPRFEQNGNGHVTGATAHGTRVFDLQPKQDPLWTQIVPKSRREVCGDTRMTEGARLLFCYITDCSLLPGVNSRPGVVRFANPYLAKYFAVSEKTIQNWKRALEQTQRIWCSEKWMKNSFPTTVYNVAAIVGPRPMSLNQDSEDGSLVDDGWSNRKRNRATRRDDRGRWTRGGGYQKPEMPKPDILTENPVLQEPERKILPSSTATHCRPQRQPIAAHNGNPLPSPTETHCRSGAQSIAAHDGNPLPLGAETHCRRGRKQIAGNGETSDVRVQVGQRILKRSTGGNAPKAPVGKPSCGGRCLVGVPRGPAPDGRCARQKGFRFHGCKGDWPFLF